jgi:hypothetical protein
MAKLKRKFFCCNELMGAIDSQVIKRDDLYFWIPYPIPDIAPNGGLSINHCPWCGKKLKGLPTPAK